MTNEDFAHKLEEIAPSPFLLHFTRRKSWVKIKKEGLVPQKSKQKDMYTKILPDHVIGCVGNMLRHTLIKINFQLLSAYQRTVKNIISKKQFLMQNL